MTQAFNDMADSIQQHIEKMENAKENAEKANTQLIAEIGERQQAEKALARHRDNLEVTVKERTDELMRAREMMIQAIAHFLIALVLPATCYVQPDSPIP